MMNQLQSSIIARKEEKRDPAIHPLSVWKHSDRFIRKTRPSASLGYSSLEFLQPPPLRISNSITEFHRRFRWRIHPSEENQTRKEKIRQYIILAATFMAMSTDIDGISRWLKGLKETDKLMQVTNYWGRCHYVESTKNEMKCEGRKGNQMEGWSWTVPWRPNWRLELKNGRNLFGDWLWRPPVNRHLHWRQLQRLAANQHKQTVADHSLIEATWVAKPSHTLLTTAKELPNGRK